MNKLCKYFGLFVEFRADSVFIAFIKSGLRLALEWMNGRGKKRWNKSEIQLLRIWWVNKNVNRNQIKIGIGRPSQHSISDIVCSCAFVCEGEILFCDAILPYEFSFSSALWASWRFNFWISSVRSQDVQVLSKATNTAQTWKYVTQC